MAKRILIAEDDDQNRILFRDLLAIYGYETAEAANGRDALILARKFRPHLIIMDIQMPVQDGLVTIELLRRDAELAGLPVIAISAYAMKGDRERIMAAGFDYYLAKPIDTMALPAVIESFLATKPFPGGKQDERVACIEGASDMAAGHRTRPEGSPSDRPYRGERGR